MMRFCCRILNVECTLELCRGPSHAVVMDGGGGRRWVAVANCTAVTDPGMALLPVDATTGVAAAPGGAGGGSVVVLAVGETVNLVTSPLPYY